MQQNQLAPPRPVIAWQRARILRSAPVFAIFMVAMLMTRYAETPALPDDLRVSADAYATLQTEPTAATPAALLIADNKTEIKRPRLRIKPASMIDDEVRQRAREAVLRTFSAEEDEPT